MSAITRLKNVPNFTFYQEEEVPIKVDYYNGIITLQQGGEEIDIEPHLLRKLFNSIIKNQAEEEELLSMR